MVASEILIKDGAPIESRITHALGETLICERCSNQIYYAEKCDYCKKMVCLLCEKSAKRVKKIRRWVICKACWGNLKARSQFKAL